VISEEGNASSPRLEDASMPVRRAKKSAGVIGAFLSTLLFKVSIAIPLAEKKKQERSGTSIPRRIYVNFAKLMCATRGDTERENYSTVTDLARFLGLSTSQLRHTAMW